MTDYRSWEVEATLDEARASELQGCAWLGLAVWLVVMAAAADAGGWRVTAVALAVWVCWPLWRAGVCWRAAADDREIAAWMEGEA